MSKVNPKNNSLRSRFISGGSWVFTGKIISSASTLAVYMLLTRLLSPEDMGGFFLGLSVVTAFSLIAQWGLGRGLVKLIASELARGNTDRVRNAITSSFVIVITISLVLAMLIYSPAGEWFFAQFSGSDLLSSITGLMGLWILVLALQSIVSESFRGFHDIRTATIFGGTLTAVISMLFYLFTWLKVERLELVDAVQLMIFATGISLIAGCALLIIKAIKYERSKNTELSNVLRFGMPLMFTSLAIFATREFHIWILAYYQPEFEVALYGASLRLMLILSMPLIIINAVLPPMIADMYSLKQYERVQNLLQKTASLMIIPAILGLILIVFYGSEILGLVYGDNYTQAYIPFIVLAVGQVVNVLTGSPGILLTMSGHERVVFKTALFSSIVGLIASLVGVQMYGATGAAFGFTVGIIVNNVLMWAYSLWALSIRTHGSLPLLIAILTRKNS